jgi:hypothetical protein
LEDLIGFLIFLLIIFSRAFKDRRQGMSRETPPRPCQVEPPPSFEPVVEPRQEAQAEPWRAWEEEPSYEEEDWGDYYRESMEGYSLPGEAQTTMEGLAGNTPAGSAPVDSSLAVIKPSVRSAPGPGEGELSTSGYPMALAGVNLQQMVAWSEILQKPKALQRRRGLGMGYRF